MTRKDKASISAQNHDKTWKYFQELGIIPSNATTNDYVLHHIDDKMRHDDPERYQLWRPQDVWPLPHGEHTRLHNKSRWSNVEYRAHMSKLNMGHPVSAKTREAVSRAHTGVKPATFRNDLRERISEIKSDYATMTTAELGVKYKAGRQTILNLLTEFNIPRRKAGRRRKA